MSQGRPSSLNIADGRSPSDVLSAVWDARFWARTKVEGDCLVWTGYRDRQGYGTVLRVAISPSPILAHRYAWMQLNGSIPEGVVIRHSCDNPPCVKGEHLLSGSQADNIADRQARGRHRPGRLHGTAHPAAKLTDAEVLEIRAAYAAHVMQSVLADRYGVSRKTVNVIVHRKNWKHLEAA